jgi:hypothetical protein
MLLKECDRTLMSESVVDIFEAASLRSAGIPMLLFPAYQSGTREWSIDAINDWYDEYPVENGVTSLHTSWCGWRG